MFWSYDHHQAEKNITTLGLLNWQRIHCFIRSHITVIVYIMLCIVEWLCNYEYYKLQAFIKFSRQSKPCVWSLTHDNIKIGYTLRFHKG
jgi:hypothetical protein